ncbi:MAG: hypothetical protein H0V17_36035 [Deltaproteobacteria bacterium]|nr:hypothetical protein [Deltaproteobacteria bacterium]
MASVALGGDAAADPNACRILDVALQPASAGDATADRYPPQIVAWLEDAGGAFVDTVFITHATGTFGLGNRPGRFDFNSAPFWPYGRRIGTFPVWAERQPLRWQQLAFQDDDDNDLSHSGAKSSPEQHYCRPLLASTDPTRNEMDAVTCPSRAFTDKGTFSLVVSKYPPRADLERVSQDAPAVEMFGLLNPFDAVSQPTPPLGATALITWAAPPLLPGEYVLWVEVSKEFDMNASYNETVFPAPTGIPWDNYGLPYRGQPSVVYRVPFTMAAGSETSATIDTYAGYGDPDGATGTLNPPDLTISEGAGTGAGRLALISEAGQTYRVKVISHVEDDVIPPDPVRVPLVDELTANRATLSFQAPGDDGNVGKVASYEIRIRATGVAGDGGVREPLTEDNFATATLVTATVDPVATGELQTVSLQGLLPETTYSIGIRAFDNCRNPGPLVIVELTTPERPIGEVDACFVATAAYGSVMAGDVDLLRRFRDSLLAKTVFGELAIESYYTFGPALAGLIGESDVLRSTARELLQPVVSRVRDVRFE